MSDKAKEIGQRLRRIRNSQGISLQELADKVGTSAPNISKYETNGLRDIEWIQSLSNALGQNLLVDEIDEEGVVGEVGNEILIVLIEHDGHLGFSQLENKLYGMDSKRVTAEIMKLSRIGMCVREQFKDFHDKQNDVVFITAKGLITCKNQIKSPLIEDRIKERIDKVVTYERLLSEDRVLKIPAASCYQEFIDIRRAEKLIRNLPITENFYRVNFILFLKHNYTSGISKEPLNVYSNLVPFDGCYHDILFRKMFNLTNEELKDRVTIGPLGVPEDQMDEYVEEWYDSMMNEEGEVTKIEKELGIYNSYRYGELRSLFIREFDAGNEWKEYMKKLPERMEALSDEKKKILEDAEYERMEQEAEIYEDRYLNLDLFFKDILESNKEKGIESMFPGDWYTMEELIEFTNLILPEASSETEKQIDRDLDEIMRLLPKTKEYYFGFDWPERDGLPDELADLIRRKYNIQ